MSDREARAVVAAAVRHICASGPGGQRPLEQIERLDALGGVARDALGAALAEADSAEVAAVVQLVRLMRASDLAKELADAALRQPAPLAAKELALEALRDWGVEIPSSVQQTLELARAAVQHPDEEILDRVLGLSEAWRGPVLDAALNGALATRPELMSRLVGVNPDLDERIVEVLGKSGKAAAVAPLRQFETGADRALKKLAKRALHQLRSQGVAIEAAVAAPAAAPFSLEITPDTRREARAYVTGIDGSGARIVWVLAPTGSGGQRLLEAVIDDEHGLRRAEVLSVTRGGFRQHVDQLRGNPGILIAHTDSLRVAALLQQAEETGKARGTGVPGEYLRFRDELAPALFTAPETREATSPYDEIPRSEVSSNRALLEGSAELLGLPYFANWAFVGARANEAAEQVRQAETSGLAVDEEQRKQQVDRAIGSVAQSFDPELRARYQARLEAMAEVLLACKHRDQARLALAAGLGFTEVSDLYSGHPFARGLIQRGVLAAYQQVRDREKRETSGQRIIQP